MSSETATMMSAIIEYARARELVPSRLIEVAGGPTVFSLLALTAALESPPQRIVFTDIAESNLREVDDWLHERLDAFDYSHLYEWLETNAQVDPERVAASLRAADWELVCVDWHHPPPAAWVDAFDVVSSHFFVESATGDRAEAIALLRNFSSVARPDALVLLSFLQRARSWDCAGVAVTSLQVHEGMIEDFLRAGGLTLAQTAIRTARGRQPAGVTGYEGVVTVTGMASRDAGR